MRVLILGATGMVGHKLWQVLSKRFDTWATARTVAGATVKPDLLDPGKLLEGIDASNFENVARAIRTISPNVVVNAIGIVKQLSAIEDTVATIKINSLLPHQLALACRESAVRLIHISTDCVFSGRKGMYTESDPPDPEDFYGRSKLLGEVMASGCLTLRTSIIGPELGSANGLLEWFLANAAETKILRGYNKAIFSGFTTLVLADIVGDIIASEPNLTGLYHVSAEPIDKYSLLCLFREAYKIPVEIEPYADIRIDRSLDSGRFRSATGFVPPSWPNMIASMSADHLRSSS
jgi:dTDP-4-dehydrorhamnose reductase